MTNNVQPYVLVFGVSIYDIFGFTDNRFKPFDSNPGRVKVSFGGVCRNIAENMARIGVNTKFISVVGDDSKGRSIMEHAASMNFDMSESLVLEGQSTPTYLAILDETGEMVSAVVDLKIADCFTEEFIDSKASVIEASEYMVFGADNPEIIEYIIKRFHGKTKFILDPVSAAKIKPLKHLIPYLHTIKPNRYEAEVICGFEIRTMEDVRRAGQHFMELGVKNIFLSLDADGIYYNNGVEEGVIKSRCVSVVNVTGAGDSLVAGISQGYMKGYSIVDTVKYAVAMANLTISHEETIHPEMGHEKISQLIEEADWEEYTF